MTQCNTDVCGIICLSLTYMCLFYGYYVIVGVIIVPLMNETLWGVLHGLLFTFSFTLCLISQFKAAYTNPGICQFSKTALDFSDLHAINENNKSDVRVCAKCEIYRPVDAHHCKICKRCIKRRHHHCHWINNCVGELNQKYFLQFLFYIAFLAVYSICFIMYSLFAYEDDIFMYKIKSSRLYHSIYLIGISIFFGLFVVTILNEQFKSIQQQRGGQASIFNCFTQMYNTKNPICWLLPFEFKIEMREALKPLDKFSDV